MPTTCPAAGTTLPLAISTNRSALAGWHRCVMPEALTGLISLKGGERKGIVLVDIGPNGRKSEPRFIEIEATPLVEVRVKDAGSSAEQLRAQVPDPETALVRVVVEPQATADATGSLDRAIRQGLPCVTS